MKRMSKGYVFRTLSDGLVKEMTGLYDWCYVRQKFAIKTNTVSEDEWWELLLYIQIHFSVCTLTAVSCCPDFLQHFWMVNSCSLCLTLPDWSISPVYCTVNKSWLNRLRNTTNNMTVTVHISVRQLFFVCLQVWLSCFPTVPMWTYSSMCHRSDSQSAATTGT